MYREGDLEAVTSNGATTSSNNSSSSNRRSALDKLAPLRIFPVYTVKGDLAGDTARSSMIETFLIPTAVSYFARLLKVRVPPAGALHITPQCSTYLKLVNGTDACLTPDLSCTADVNVVIPASLLSEYSVCNNTDSASCSTSPAGAGVQQADLILFVTAQATALCASGTQAVHASHCYQDAASNRPIAGYLNLCPQKLTYSLFHSPEFDEMLGGVLHGIIHVLGFNSQLFPSFLDSTTGTAYTSVVSNAPSGGSPSAPFVVTPTVTAMARRQTSCPTLIGGELQVAAADGSNSSHWSARVFEGEVMTSEAGGPQVVSNLTLALLQDTGWYEVNYGLAGFLAAGFHAGCDYALQPCTDPSTLKAVFRDGYCAASDLARNATLVTYSGSQQSTPMDSLCSSDHLATATCRTNCSTECPYDGCIPKQRDQGHRCQVPGDQTNKDNQFGESFGLQSRCFLQGTLYWVSNTAAAAGAPPGAGCYKTQCSWPPGGAPTLSVNVAGVWLNCTDGKYLELTETTFAAGQLGPCPVAADVCASAMCPNDCSARGQCYMGKCHCSAAYGGPACSQVACSPLAGSNVSSCPAASTCEVTSGLCVTATGALAGIAPAYAPPYPPPLPPAPPSPPPPPFTPPAYSPTSQPPPPGVPQITAGVLVTARIRFSGANYSRVIDPGAYSDFQKNFRQQMMNAARQTGYEGPLEVTVDKLVSGSIIVYATVNFYKSTTYVDPDNFAGHLLSNPTVVFASSGYFLALPSGQITASNVDVTPAPSTNTAPKGKSKKVLGLPVVLWVVLAVLLGCAVLIGAVILLRRASERRKAEWAAYRAEQEEYEQYELDADYDPYDDYAQLVAEAQTYEQDHPDPNSQREGDSERVSIPAIPDSPHLRGLTHVNSSGRFPQKGAGNNRPNGFLQRAASGPVMFTSGPRMDSGPLSQAAAAAAATAAAGPGGAVAGGGGPGGSNRPVRSLSGPVKVVWAGTPRQDRNASRQQSGRWSGLLGFVSGRLFGPRSMSSGILSGPMGGPPPPGGGHSRRPTHSGLLHQDFLQARHSRELGMGMGPGRVGRSQSLTVNVAAMEGGPSDPHTAPHMMGTPSPTGSRSASRANSGQLGPNGYPYPPPPLRRGRSNTMPPAGSAGVDPADFYGGDFSGPLNAYQASKSLKYPRPGNRSGQLSPGGQLPRPGSFDQLDVYAQQGGSGSSSRQPRTPGAHPQQLTVATPPTSQMEGRVSGPSTPTAPPSISIPSPRSFSGQLVSPHRMSGQPAIPVNLPVQRSLSSQLHDQASGGPDVAPRLPARAHLPTSRSSAALVELPPLPRRPSAGSLQHLGREGREMSGQLGLDGLPLHPDEPASSPPPADLVGRQLSPRE
eukprot:jgi/Mesen1/9570/ME000065S08996